MICGVGSMKLPPFERFSTGLLAGTAFALVFAWLLDSDVSNAIKDRWVEVFGIVAALFAAVLALLGVQRQIRVQTDQADAERLAQLRASLAVLPLVLSGFYRVSESCVEVSLDTPEVIRDPNRRDDLLRVSEIGETHLEVLRDCIRYSDAISAGWLTLIARQYQLCVARYISLIEGTHILLDVNQQRMAIDWAVLRAISGHSFDFARGEVDRVPLTMNPNQVVLPISSRHYGTPLFEGARSLLNEMRAGFGLGRAENYFG